MKASWNGQICKSEGKFSIQFETDNYYLYRYVEKACQKVMDMIGIPKKMKSGAIPTPRELDHAMDGDAQ